MTLTIKYPLIGEIEDPFTSTFRRKAIRRVLAKPEDIQKKKTLHKWFSDIESDDMNVLGDLFRREWEYFEFYIDNEADKHKLKKMFDIK